MADRAAGVRPTATISVGKRNASQGNPFAERESARNEIQEREKVACERV